MLNTSTPGSQEKRAGLRMLFCRLEDWTVSLSVCFACQSLFRHVEDSCQANSVVMGII